MAQVLAMGGLKFQPTRPRGARPGALPIFRRVGVSTHAPARGATREMLQGHLCLRSFQPTRPRGARPLAEAVMRMVDEFQPTRPRGARHWIDWVAVGVAAFQPTRPRGARRGSSTTTRRRTSFNPRAREGRDARRPDLPVARTGVSTHAPARGATRQRQRDRTGTPCFNPRAREGRDVPGSAGRRNSSRFQPTRPRGARPCIFKCLFYKTETSTLREPSAFPCARATLAV